MTKIVVYTHLKEASQITLELDAKKVAFKPLGGGDGVPPGVAVMEGDEVVCYVGAQDFGVAVVKDKRVVTVEGFGP